MELLLNLVWIASGLALSAVIFRSHGFFSRSRQVPYLRILLAVGCALVLLFPVVSASDDLHPTTAVFEDASKRAQRFVSAVREVQSQTQGQMPFFAALLALSLLFSLAILPLPLPEARLAPELLRARSPRSGRAPPAR